MRFRTGDRSIEKLAAALAERDEVEAANEAGELSPVAYGKALTLADAKVQAAEALLAEAEAGRGWLGQERDAFGALRATLSSACASIPPGAFLRTWALRVGSLKWT